MGIVENTYAELKQQELKNNPYSCLHMADIDINPHQIEAFTFALSSLELGGAILADEVGLGKTIEAGLVIKYLLCSGKNKILLIMPSNLRKQWQVELEEKFDIDSLIVDSSNWEDYLAKVKSKQAVIIVSYHFASKRKTEFGKIAWDFCVFDEAHRLRNVYKNGSKMANLLYELTKGIPKILLTATPMQNTLLDIYGLVQFMRDYFDMDQYKKNQGEVKCPKCGFPAYPSRFITVCEDGHMDDFPWRWWVHHGETSCKEDMYLKSMGNTSSLAELRVECNCGARRVMSGAMQKEKFAGLCCSGNHPHRPGAKAKICKKSVIPSQRGASNVYFTVTRNAISIPPWTNPINDIMGAQRATIETLVEAMGEEAGLSFAYQKYFGDKYSYEDFKAAYDRLSQNIKEFTELKEMEYAAITHHEDVEYQHDVKYFKAEEVALSESLKEYISRIIKIHRLREVRVLTGFTRLEAPEPEVDEQSHIVKLKCSSGEKWLPAVEINGEGVFIELNKEKKINQWMQIETVKSRSDKYEECYAAYCQKKGWENFKPRNAEYVLLHTLSHMLIKEMSMQSGYSSSALHERIYSSENMCGILIYTGAADKEGSLGGLVELGEMNKFLPLLKGALENGLTCTTDPECFMKNPTSERLNGAACHSCTMISETACENGNRLLDRALVVPVPEHEEMGYFRELVRDLCGIQV